ncbi:hypothetical protein [Mycolicibacterium poriferae]|uniref:hypothetical protein n=1 Tax=Mycolicibacterium poriferae TaxID=39694 RepID=UPI00321B6D27
MLAGGWPYVGYPVGGVGGPDCEDGPDCGDGADPDDELAWFATQEIPHLLE